MYPRSVGDVLYPYVLTVPQSRTERLLLERLQELGGTVDRSRELVALRQDEDVVEALIGDTQAGGTKVQEMRARWIVGCDGSHSAVRKLLDIPFEGSTRDEEFLLADVDLDWEKDRDINHIWLPQGRQWRLFADVAQVSGALSSADGGAHGREQDSDQPSDLAVEFQHQPAHGTVVSRGARLARR